MALSLSTGFRDGILDTNHLQQLLDDGEIRIFSGAGPSSADDTETGSLLVTINLLTGNANNCQFKLTASAGVIQKQIVTWDGEAVATDTAGYFRYCASTADAGGSSTTEIRLQGAVATSGAELNMSSVTITTSATTTIDTFDITMPAT